MKKTLKRFIFASILISNFLTFFGCQDIIYDNIRKEVSLEDGTVYGTIRSIIRFNCDGTEYFYISNGATIYRKEISRQSYGGWEDVSPAGLGDFIIDLAADSNNLYAFSATWEENTSKGQNRWNGRAIYCSEDGGKTWVKVESFYTSPNYASSYTSPVNLFCTNSIKSNNRKAYYNHDGNVYELNGKTPPTSPMSLGTNNASTTPTKNSVACTSLKGTVYFFNYSSLTHGAAACTNETNTGGDETVYYYSNGSTLYWNGAGEGNKSVGNHIYSLALTKDYLLVGTYSGIKHYKLDEAGNVGAEEEFATNAAAIMTSSYEVNALAVADPSKNETENVIYAAIDFEGRNQQFNHICIWAYYPSRGNWNRD